MFNYVKMGPVGLIQFKKVWLTTKNYQVINLGGDPKIISYTSRL
jgi:hypothetical protein